MKILEYQYQRSTSNCRDSCEIRTKYGYLVEVKVGLSVCVPAKVAKLSKAKHKL